MVLFWLNRYHRQDGQGEWFKGESKAPKTKPYRIGKDVEEQVIYAREKLEKQRHAQTGAVAIQYTILNLGQQPPPIWTIKRILTSSGLNKKSSQSYKKSNKDYPTVFLHTHQMDLLGPRFIKGDGRYYTVNIIDTECRSCFVRPVRTKTTADIMDILVLFWSTHGIPGALKMDNELAFRESNRYSRSIGAIVRLALAFNIAPVFIPVAEPWRNGIV